MILQKLLSFHTRISRKPHSLIKVKRSIVRAKRNKPTYNTMHYYYYYYYEDFQLIKL